MLNGKLMDPGEVQKYTKYKTHQGTARQKKGTKLRKGCGSQAVTGANGFDVSSYDFEQQMSKNGKACCFTLPSYSNHIA